MGSQLSRWYLTTLPPKTLLWGQLIREPNPWPNSQYGKFVGNEEMIRRRDWEERRLSLIRRVIEVVNGKAIPTEDSIVEVLDFLGVRATNG